MAALARIVKKGTCKLEGVNLGKKHETKPLFVSAIYEAFLFGRPLAPRWNQHLADGQFDGFSEPVP
jgi:hypothetical protein